MNRRRSKEAEDWLGAGFNVAIGVFPGLAVNGLLELVVSGFWSLAVIVVVVCAGLALFLFDGPTGRLTNTILGQF